VVWSGAALLAVLLLAGAGLGAWRLQQRAVASAQANRALEDAAVFQAGGKWAEALLAAQRAELPLDADLLDAATGQRVHQRLADLKMLARLDDVRLVEADRFDAEATDEGYRAAFLDYGIDVLDLEQEQAAELIKASAIPVELATALDHWASVCKRTRSKGDTTWKRLLGIARAADPAGKFRNGFRNAYERGDKKALIEKARAAQALSPVAAAYVGNALSQIDAHELAIALLREAQQLHPDDFWINHQLALCLQLTKPAQLEEALRFFTAAMVLRARSPGSHVNLGGVLNDLGRLKEAEAEYRMAIRLEPKYAAAHNSLGNVLNRQGQLGLASGEYQKAIELDPKDPKPHNGLGNVLVKEGRVEHAKAEFRKAIELESKYAAAHANLGGVLALEVRLDQAIAELREALQIDKGFAWGQGHHNLALALADRGQLKEAITAYREALRLPGDFALANNNLAWMLATCKDANLRNPAEAVRLAQRAVALVPRAGIYWNTLGVAQYRAGDWNAALTALGKSMELREGGESYDWFFLAMAHWQLGQKEQARCWYDKAVAWMDKHQPQNEELRRFYAEAAALLAIEPKAAPQGKGQVPAKK
jgi:tetratricopeptide (TPR) repeat protein